jgi:hypothetical protein
MAGQGRVPEPPRGDPLSEVLDLASREGALEGEALAAFLEALRERARLVLAERFERQEARLRELEAESAWRREAMATLEAGLRSLEGETAWRREAMATLEAGLRSLKAEAAWRRESMASLEENVRALGQQAERLSDDRRRASEAHGALLAHHRELVERVAAELVSIAALSPLRARQARRRLRTLAGLLRTDSR